MVPTTYYANFCIVAASIEFGTDRAVPVNFTHECLFSTMYVDATYSKPVSFWQRSRSI